MQVHPAFCAAALSLCLVIAPLQVTSSNASVFQIHAEGTIISSVAGTGIAAGLPVELTALLDTSTPPTFFGSSTFADAATLPLFTIGGFTPTPLSAPFNSVTAFNNLFSIHFRFDGMSAPYSLPPPGGEGLLTIIVGDGTVTILPDSSNLSSLTLAELSPISVLVFTTSDNISAVHFSALEITQVPEVPIPPSLLLFASGLGALGLLGWRRKRKALAT
jgi:hypothetical protein